MDVKKPDTVRTVTIKTKEGKTEYVGQIGWEVKDRAGRVIGFKAHTTSVNCPSIKEVNKWIRSKTNEL